MAKKNDLFFQTFVGEYVNVVTKVKTKTVQTTNDQQVEAEMPIILEGFLLDKDDNYYYLGQTPDGIDSAMKIEEVIQVEIVSPKDIYEQLLDEMDVENKGVN